MVKSTHSTLMCLCLLCFDVAARSGAQRIEDLFLEAPIIDDFYDEYITLNSGENFSIKCTSEYPVTWKPFQGFNGALRLTHNVIDTELRHETILHLTEVNSLHVGRYFCVANQTKDKYDYSVRMEYDIEEYRRQFSGLGSFYALVESAVNLLASEEHPIANVVDDKSLLFPCKRANSRSESIVKFYSEGIEISDNMIEYAAGGTFLKFNSTMDVYGKSYECRTIGGESLTFNVTYRLPEIQSSIGVLGSVGDSLILNCTLPILPHENVNMKWTWNKTIPLKGSQSPDIVDHPFRSDIRVAVNTLIINVLDVNDEGYYICEVIDHMHHRLSDRIFIAIEEGTGETSPEIYAVDNKYTLEVSTWRSISLQARYKGHPKPSLKWHYDDNEVIDPYTHEVSDINGLVILKIEALDMMYMYLNDMSAVNYTLRATNTVNSTEKKFLILLRGPPKITDLINRAIILKMEEYICKLNAYPPAIVTWSFIPCKTEFERISCDRKKLIQFEDSNVTTRTDSETKQTSVLLLDPNKFQFGKIECKAVNVEGIDKRESQLEVPNDIKKVRIIGPNEMILTGDHVSITCEGGWSRYADLQFLRNNSVIDSSNHRTVSLIETDEFLQKKITWTRITVEDSGNYTCKARVRHWELIIFEQTESVSIKVHEPQAPHTNGKNYSNEEKLVSLGASSVLYCDIKGLPNPNIKWHKGGKVVGNHDAAFFIKNVTIEDIEGEYECSGSNAFGSATKIFKLKIAHQVTFFRIIFYILGAAFLAVVIYSLARFGQLRRELILLDHFVDGMPESLNQNLALHEQANMLPYNRKYEFPIERLKLGKQLGGGAFGVVFEGLAVGIMKREEETKVAVKMLRETSSTEELAAIVCELKILVNLGQHLNIVNLLGAVTKKLAKYEVMVIVEFCRFGNMQNFLMENRELFIDQIIENDFIDPTILGTRPTDSNLKYVQLHACYSETSFTTNNSDAERFITTSDLICWLFQVARGMNYLSSRKVLHGDLAARNVLLSDDNVVKICDFGLARSLYKYDNYQKKKSTRLPLKWLAIESMCDGVFSTFSDVWSFGVLMWEFFSLGAMPYPGIDTVADLIAMLSDGYRLRKPRASTQKIYDIMLHCWDFNSKSRPTFDALEAKFRELLANGVAEHYVDLNMQYVEMNATTAAEGHTDYLSLIASPEEVLINRCAETDEYLPMKPILPREQ